MRLIHFWVPLEEGEQRAGGLGRDGVIPIGGYPCALPPENSGQQGGRVGEASNST